MKLTFRKELLSGKKMIGTLVSLPCPPVTEILCDAAFIGPYDLSASMGIPGKISDPEVQNCMRQVREACAQRNMPIGIFAISVDDARPYLDQGYALIAVGVDTMMLGQAAQDVVKEMKK